MDVYGGSNCLESNLNDVDPVLTRLSQTETNINLVILILLQCILCQIIILV